MACFSNNPYKFPSVNPDTITRIVDKITDKVELLEAVSNVINIEAESQGPINTGRKLFEISAWNRTLASIIFATAKTSSLVRL